MTRTKKQDKAMPPVSIPISEVIETYLQKNHIAQAEFAKKAGISPATLSRILNAHSAIQPKTWRKIKTAYPDIGKSHVSIPIAIQTFTTNEEILNKEGFLGALLSSKNKLSAEEIGIILRWLNTSQAEEIFNEWVPLDIIAKLLSLLVKCNGLASVPPEKISYIPNTPENN